MISPLYFKTKKSIGTPKFSIGTPKLSIGTPKLYILSHLTVKSDKKGPPIGWHGIQLMIKGHLEHASYICWIFLQNFMGPTCQVLFLVFFLSLCKWTPPVIPNLPQVPTMTRSRSSHLLRPLPPALAELGAAHLWQSTPPPASGRARRHLRWSWPLLPPSPCHSRRPCS
jgi:hypothetical protein